MGSAILKGLTHAPVLQHKIINAEQTYQENAHVNLKWQKLSLEKYIFDMYVEFKVWSMFHPLTWKGRGLSTIL